MSPLLYGQATCAQLLGEIATLSLRLDPLEKKISRNVRNDSLWVGSYVVAFILLPFTFFMIQGDGPAYEEYSGLLGQREAVQQQIDSRPCSTG